MKFRSLVAAGVCGASLYGCEVASAQQQQPPTRPGLQVQVPGVGVQIGGQPAGVQAVQRPAGQVNDHALATCLAIDNQEEIAIGKFAQEKAHSKDVKAFAEMISKDHQAFLQKLQRYAPEATRDGFLTETAPRQVQRSNESPRNTVDGKVQSAGEEPRKNTGIQQTAATDETVAVQVGPMSDFLQLHREIAQECVAESQRQLSKKDGKEFDECFIGHQIAKHGAMKVKLVVFQRHATGELRQVIADGLETTEAHLKKAEQIMKKLADSSDSKSASKN